MFERKLATSLATLTLIALAACTQEAPVESQLVDPHAPTISFDGDRFSPLRLEVESGQQVQFVNQSDKPFWPASNIHPTHQIYPELDAQTPIEPGSAWVFTFEQPGFWRYHNHLGLERGGLVVVLGEPDEPPIPLVLTTDGLEFEEPTELSLTQYVDLYDSDVELTRFLREFGPAGTVKALEEGARITNADCHQRAHDAGRKAYDLFGAAAFYLSSHECQAGSYHGATEALFRDRGTVNLQEDVSVLCSYAVVSFYYLQCLHGVGHGLMAWTSYELRDVLALCEELSTDNDHEACYSGVFMENVIGGLSGTMGHVTEYLSDDPHYPCNSLHDGYVRMCYFYQSTRMMILFQNDFAKVSQSCAAAPEEAHHYCFRSMGRDTSAVSAWVTLSGESSCAVWLIALPTEGSASRALCRTGSGTHQERTTC